MYSLSVLLVTVLMCASTTTFAVDTRSAPARCQQPFVSGPCKGKIERVGYDVQTDQCTNFTYGGCGGNSNNFMSVEECNTACAHVHPGHVTEGARNKTCCTASTIDPCADHPCGISGMCVPDHTVRRGYRCECSPFVYSCPTGTVCAAPCEFCGGVCVEESVNPCELQGACGARGQCIRGNATSYDCQCSGLAGFECPGGMECEVPMGCVDCFGTCRKQQSCAKQCDERNKPVCGSNGHTYTNECFFEIAQCIFPSLTIARYERC